MRFIQRLGYYLGGFSIGLIILAFFFSGKKTSCAYFPDARVLKKITTKKTVLSENAQEIAATIGLDTIALKEIIKDGDVDFGQSEPRKEPCGVYFITSDTKDGKSMLFRIENCEKTATIREITIAN